VQKPEDDDGHDEHNDDPVADPAQEIPDHSDPPGLLSATGPGRGRSRALIPAIG
jgi:hypothetical protein